MLPPGFVGTAMDLMCCGKRAAPRQSLFHPNRKLGLNIDEGSGDESADGKHEAKSTEQQEDQPPAVPRFSRVERNRRPHQDSPDHDSSGEDEDMDLSPLDRLASSFKRQMAVEKVGEKLKAKRNQRQQRKEGPNHNESRSHHDNNLSESSSASGATDPFLVNGGKQSVQSEEALLARLTEIASQLRGEIQVRRHSETS